MVLEKLPLSVVVQHFNTKIKSRIVLFMLQIANNLK